MTTSTGEPTGPDAVGPHPTLPPLDSPEVVAEHARMRRRAGRRRRLTTAGAVAIALWILLPIFFVFSMAFTTQETVRSYPKNVLPFIPFSRSLPLSLRIFRFSNLSCAEAVETRLS